MSTQQTHPAWARPSDHIRQDVPGVLLGELRLVNAPESARVARRFLLVVTAGWAVPHVAETAELLVSELVGNAVRHARGMPGSTLRVLVIRRRQRLRVEVHDPSRHLPHQREAAVLDEVGRGLLLVTSLASAYGAYPTAFGKAVWFELETHWPASADIAS